jgi:tetratricopeptide (TPR) repeat protein
MVRAATRKLSSPYGRSLAALVLIGLAISPLRAAAKCTLAKVVDLPITMSDMRPTITAKINGVDAQFLLDSGAFFSIISSATADQFNLRRGPAPQGLRIIGVGGSADASVATVKIFTIVGVPLHNLEFLVGGSEVGGGAIGILGQNFLEKWDVEYDLAKGVVRLMKADDCKHARLAYWVGAEQPLSMMDIDYATPWRPHTTGTAYINGTKINVMFDTGAPTSVLSSKAAARAGVTRDTAGAVDAGYSSGVGRKTVRTYIASFASFKIGDNEEIQNARLRIADIDLDEGDMLIGADFFLSHHIYVANSQHRLYITYNGGPVFNLSKSASAKVDADSNPEAPRQDVAPADAPADATGFARRGEAFAGRRDFEHALADLTRACELNPNNPEYPYQRGVAHWNNNQPVPAMIDFDHALELNPEYLPARVSRAQLRLANKDISGATADLDAADRLAPKQADVRFTLAEFYEAVELTGPAVAQYDLWISNHPDDSKMTGALNGRCWLRALQGQELAKALADCNRALSLSAKASPSSAAVLDSRGLVRLRMGDYDKAIADYDESLKIAPKRAWPLYGRGVAKMRKKKTEEGEADIAAAAKVWPKIADEFNRRGITP